MAVEVEAELRREEDGARRVERAEQLRRGRRRAVGRDERRRELRLRDVDREVLPAAATVFGGEGLSMSAMELQGTRRTMMMRRHDADWNAGDK